MHWLAGLLGAGEDVALPGHRDEVSYLWVRRQIWTGIDNCTDNCIINCGGLYAPRQSHPAPRLTLLPP